MPLKKRTITPSADDGAGLLPGLMASQPAVRRLEQLSLQSLSPAPAEWNFYSPLTDGKFIELIDSIQANGLLHPIVVWRQPDGINTVLSGHNRLHAYRVLYQKTGNPDYAAIPATVLTDITKSEAREIVIDSNWVQRSLTPSERAKSIYQKYLLSGRKQRSANGTRRSNYDIIAEEYGLSSRQIARYIRLAQLDNSMQELVDSGRLSLGNALKLADFPAEKQCYLAQHWTDRLRSKQVMRLSPDMTEEEIDRTLQAKEAVVRVSFEMPASLERRFRRMAAQWLEENEEH